MAQFVVEGHMPGRPPRQAILPFEVQVTDKSDALTSRAGLPLVAETMRALGVAAAVAQHVKLQQRESGLTDYHKLESVVLLLAAGGVDLGPVARLVHGPGLCYALVPEGSPEVAGWQTRFQETVWLMGWISSAIRSRARRRRIVRRVTT